MTKNDLMCLWPILWLLCVNVVRVWFHLKSSSPLQLIAARLLSAGWVSSTVLITDLLRTERTHARARTHTWDRNSTGRKAITCSIESNKLEVCLFYSRVAALSVYPAQNGEELILYIITVCYSNHIHSYIPTKPDIKTQISKCHYFRHYHGLQ